MFAMWIFGTSAVASYHFGASDVTSAAYNDGADWNGVLFASYNLYAALAAIAIPFVASRLGCRISHLVNLSLGGLGLISFYFIGDPKWLLLSMVGVGFAWASILSLPYTLLSNNLPAHKMGIYMGIFNFFIVLLRSNRWQILILSFMRCGSIIMGFLLNLLHVNIFLHIFISNKK